jgi:AAA domain-containing protein
VSTVFAALLNQFTGVVIATPFAGCKAAFVRHFQADIVAVDEAARLSELDQLQVVRFHSPKLLIIVGDPEQLPVFVPIARMTGNPWEAQARLSLRTRISTNMRPSPKNNRRRLPTTWP